MKSLFAALIFASTTLLAAPPTVIDADVENLFVPSGYDSNDNVELFVSGSLPSTCHTRNRAEFSVQGSTINVQVTQIFSLDLDGGCHIMNLPFVETVSLGPVPEGVYTVVVNGVLKESMIVTRPHAAGRDDFIYAMIDEINVEEGKLVGKTMSDCLEFDHVEYVSNSKDTLAILPIMRRTSEFCSGRRTRFEVPVSFNLERFSAKKVLVIVRTLDGKAVFKLIEK